MSLATISNISGDHLPLAAKRGQLDFVQAMNRRHLAQRPADDELEGVIASMELAFRMQATAPQLLDLTSESKKTLERYRVGKKLSIGTCRPTRPSSLRSAPTRCATRRGRLARSAC